MLCYLPHDQEVLALIPASGPTLFIKVGFFSNIKYKGPFIKYVMLRGVGCPGKGYVWSAT